MPESKRRFWQIHLSTLLVLTLLAGALVSANLERPHITSSHGCNTVIRWSGWPIASQSSFESVKYEPSARGYEDDENERRFKLALSKKGFARYADWNQVGLNTVLCLCLLLLSAALWETLIRSWPKGIKLRFSLRTLMIGAILAAVALMLVLRLVQRQYPDITAWDVYSKAVGFMIALACLALLAGPVWIPSKLCRCPVSRLRLFLRAAKGVVLMAFVLNLVLPLNPRNPTVYGVLGAFYGVGIWLWISGTPSEPGLIAPAVAGPRSIRR